MLKFTITLALIILTTTTALTETHYLNIAVASNFFPISILISKNFEKHNNCKTLTSSDSTSNLFTKIKNNAQFNIFLSADKKHTKILEKINLFKNKKYTYAKGKIIIIKKDKIIKKQILKYFKIIKNIALSNSNLSPYGKTSKTALKNLKIIYDKNAIFCSNINQTFISVLNNASELGLTALSYAIHNKTKKNTYWKIPKYLYPTIKQSAILLKNENDNKLNKSLFNYMKIKKTKNIIKKYGYKTKK